MGTRAVIQVSASAIGVYLTCEKRYLLEYVYRQGGEGRSFAAAIGAAVHAGVDALWQGRTDPYDVLRRRWAREVALMPAYDEDPAVGQADAERMLTVYGTQVKPTFVGETRIEVPFSITVNGMGVTGTIDAMNDDLRDLKTTAGKSINGRKAPTFTPSRYDLQLGLYRIAYRFITGHDPKRTILDVLTRRGTYRTYERKTDPTETLDTIGVVTDGILGESYRPTGAYSGMCKWCPVSGVCSDAILD